MRKNRERWEMDVQGVYVVVDEVCYHKLCLKEDHAMAINYIFLEVEYNTSPETNL